MPSPLREWQEIRALSKRLDKLVREWRPDQLHVHSPVLNALAALPVAKRHAIPLIYEIRAFWEDAAVGNGTGSEGSPRYRLTRALETYAAARADAVAVICEGLAGTCCRAASPPKDLVSPNGVDMASSGSPLAPNAFRAKLARGADVVGFIGSFYDYEGWTISSRRCRCCSEAAQGAPAAGRRGPMEAALKARRRFAAADGSTSSAGAARGVTGYYSLIDVLAYPRKAMRLTELVTPMKPLEAMAQRKLVAASDVGGHRELIEDGVTGTLFPAGDPQGIADALAGLFANRGGWEERRDEARRFVERDRNWSSNILRYLPVYQRLTGKAL
jgi:PEP-CTERM/exosortase A-associated glycosyltransferase